LPHLFHIKPRVTVKHNTIPIVPNGPDDSDETILNCKYCLLHSHLEAKDRKSWTLILKISCTSCQSRLDIMHSKNRCETDSISLHKLHSKDFGIPLFLRLSLVKILFCENNQRKFWILGGIFKSQIAEDKWVGHP
jgi:hypothetical protein